MSKKNVMPMPTGGGLLPKLIGSAVLVALVVVVVKYPTDAASAVEGLISIGESVVDGIARFLHQVAA